MPANEFLAQFGFEADPFQSTNAEDEPRLGDYFVPPPYFTSVMGDPDDPSSDVVLAPRGSGKTAERRMIEARSTTNEFLCVTYDTFDMPAGFKIEEADLAYHLNQLCRLLVLGVLLKLEEDPYLSENLTEHQRQLLKFQVDRFLGSLSQQEFESAVRSIKSFGDKAGDVWRKYGGPLAAAIQAMLKKAGLDVDVPADLVSEAKRDETLRYHFETLLRIAKSLWLRSSYVLVDKVDETALTNSDAGATYVLIRSLITDLPTLEADGCGFKFFLWDRLGDAYRTTGGRPDRIAIHELRWTVDELAQMLGQRLSAFSAGAVTSFNRLLCPDTALDVDALLSHLAGGSPRDLIRLAGRIIDEATRVTALAPCVAEPAVWDGVRRFCEELAQELCPQYMTELKKVQRPTFTINYVGNEVYHVGHESARSKIQKWMATGVVQQIGELPNPGSRPMHLFGVVDLRVAIAALPASEVPLILGNYAVICPDCDTVNVSDQANIACARCGRSFGLADAQSLLDRITR